MREDVLIPHMQTVGLSPEVPVLLPVQQLGPDRVATLLLDHLGDELWTRHIDEVERSQLGAPDWPVQTLLNPLGQNGTGLNSQI